MTEAERIRAAEAAYRAARIERIPPTPKVRDARTWKPYAEVYLPLAAVNLHGILESLPLDAEVRQSEVSDVLYIGRWLDDPMEEVERIVQGHVPPFDTLDSDNLERP